MQTIDLRSDTVTKPSAEMFEAMMSAEVGDDVFREDPTVNELEEHAAGLFGKESALFCPSGTMTNQIAIKVHTQPGNELICDVNSHIYNYEGGGIALNSGVQARLVHGTEGRLSVEQIEPYVNAEYDWLAKTSLVCLENTVNRAGGSYYKLEQIKPIHQFCSDKKLKLHLDGARIFNAFAETGEDGLELGKYFDSISICLSKGLGAPVGSLLIADQSFIKEARRYRKVFGGGMRQAGILAAAGLFALKNNIYRLKTDHYRAQKLQAEIMTLPYIESVLPVYTNIIIFNLKKEWMSADDFVHKLAKKNIRVVAFGKHTIRLVTHLDFTDEMLDQTIDSLKNL